MKLIVSGGLSMSTRGILKIIRAIASLSMIMLLVSCGGGGGSGGNPGAESNPGLYSDLKTANVDLSTSTPIEKNMGFSYNGAEYDTDYLNHWKIATYGGDMSFTFEGPQYFSYHARSFASNSGCYINVYVNGGVYEFQKIIGDNWVWYNIPPTAFGSDTNTVKIKLVGDTIWLDVATTPENPLL